MIAVAPGSGTVGAAEAAADYLAYTARAVAGGLEPSAWARHERALARWARAKAAAQAEGFGLVVRTLEDRLVREAGPAILGAVP